MNRADIRADDAASARRFAVLGSPVSHSLSPVLHRAGFAAAGLAGYAYDAIDCDALTLPGLVSTAGPEWVGFSVTMPGKAAAAAAASIRSPRVSLLGVANTLSRLEPAGLIGWAAENTDVDGILGALRTAGVERPRHVLLLGGGHTARAAVAALAEWGQRAEPVRVLLAGRRPDSTADCASLCAELGLPATQIAFEPAEIASLAVDVDLVVATVPAGSADPLARVLAGVPALLDVVYHPWPTAVAAAGRPGRITVTGLDMLLHQALRQFELFTGQPMTRDVAVAMRNALRAAAGTKLPLAL